MTIKNLFTFTAIVCLIMAISLTFTPQMLSDLYNIDPIMSHGSIVLGRSFGALMLGLGISLWMSRNAVPFNEKRSLLIIIIISCGLIAINYVHGILTGVNTNMGWGLVILTTILSVWAGKIWLKEIHN